MKFNLSSNEFIEKEINSEKIAIYSKDKMVTWKSFYTQVDSVCASLLRLNIPKGHPIILWGHKQDQILVFMAACMRLGIPYIPVDSNLPIQRLLKIVELSRSTVLINFDAGQLDIDLNVFDSQLNQLRKVDFHHLAVFGSDENPIIYIIFTSGSTGEPKGVMISKEALVSFMNWISVDFGFTSDDVFINQAIFSFDLSVYEIAAFLGLGASIILNSKEESSKPDLFLKKIKDFGGTVWVSTPSFASTFLLNSQFNSRYLPTLKTFLFCGETLSKGLAAKLRAHFSARVLNSYGPTEATVATTLVNIDEDILQKYDSLPVGYPKNDGKILINSPSDNGEVGEIIIQGPHVASGYISNDLNNHKKFTLNNGCRQFHTGDSGYFKDGMLFFVGRLDFQIKFNGFRIELGEIDTCLGQVKGVKGAVTIALRRNGEVKKLVSFVVATDDTTSIFLKTELKKALPEYMIPSEICFMNQFPVSENQKIDRKSLENIYLANGSQLNIR